MTILCEFEEKHPKRVNAYGITSCAKFSRPCGTQFVLIPNRFLGPEPTPPEIAYRYPSNALLIRCTPALSKTSSVAAIELPKPMLLHASSTT
jgi:hypothetical protein